jgi:hypothetical protein
MKSAYELAMERLQKQSPTVKLTDDQKRQLAVLDAEYKAKVADREIFLQGQIEKAVDAGDAEAIQQLERQLASERKKLQTELDEKKERIRQSKA